MSATVEDMCDTAFDEALRLRFAEARHKFRALHRPGYFGTETQESLLSKAQIVKARMAEGYSFSDACDSPEVYLGQQDRTYISHLVYRNGDRREPIDLDRFRLNHLIHEASDHIRRAAHD